MSPHNSQPQQYPIANTLKAGFSTLATMGPLSMLTFSGKLIGLLAGFTVSLNAIPVLGQALSLLFLALETLVGLILFLAVTGISIFKLTSKWLNKRFVNSLDAQARYAFIVNHKSKQYQPAHDAINSLQDTFIRAHDTMQASKALYNAKPNVTPTGKLNIRHENQQFIGDPTGKKFYDTTIKQSKHDGKLFTKNPERHNDSEIKTPLAEQKIEYLKVFKSQTKLGFKSWLLSLFGINRSPQQREIIVQSFVNSNQDNSINKLLNIKNGQFDLSDNNAKVLADRMKNPATREEYFREFCALPTLKQEVVQKKMKSIAENSNGFWAGNNSNSATQTNEQKNTMILNP